MVNDDKRITRRKFLKIGGSVLVGTLFVGVTGKKLWQMLTRPETLFYDTARVKAADVAQQRADFVSPYRRTFAFEAPADIDAMTVADDNILLVAANQVFVYGMGGVLKDSFPVPSEVRDITVFDRHIYLLFPTRIEVYDMNGDMSHTWEACSDNSDYCAFTVFEGGVFVTDAQNKNICKYRLDGTLDRFIDSPAGFIVPSYSFGITHIGDAVFCSNPGRHAVEQYSVAGDYVASFGKPGAAWGEFSGCCNPVHLTPAPGGELLTSEKGIPRVSCYALDGSFRSVLLDDKALGGGHVAYDVRAVDDKLIVCGGHKVSVFQYNSQMAANTLCGNCEVECPLKVL